jgi:hypothetical protein
VDEEAELSISERWRPARVLSPFTGKAARLPPGRQSRDKSHRIFNHLMNDDQTNAPPSTRLITVRFRHTERQGSARRLAWLHHHSTDRHSSGGAPIHRAVTLFYRCQIPCYPRLNYARSSPWNEPRAVCRHSPAADARAPRISLSFQIRAGNAAHARPWLIAAREER